MQTGTYRFILRPNVVAQQSLSTRMRAPQRPTDRGQRTLPAPRTETITYVHMPRLQLGRIARHVPLRPPLRVSTGQQRALTEGPEAVTSAALSDHARVSVRRMAHAGVWTKLFRRAHWSQTEETACETTTSEQPTPEDLSPLPRSQQWSRRMMLPPTKLNIVRAPWADAEDLPDYKEWQKYLKAINPERASNDLRFYMTRGLVDEVIYAAGGMEREVTTLKEILSVAQQFCNAYSTAPPNGSFVTPKIGLYAAQHASYSLVNALSWARAVRDRVERYRFNNAYGLLPSLKDSDLKAHISIDFENLKSQLQQSIFAANYFCTLAHSTDPPPPAFKYGPMAAHISHIQT
jgi:hypothetical protein